MDASISSVNSRGSFAPSPGRAFSPTSSKPISTHRASSVSSYSSVSAIIDADSESLRIIQQHHQDISRIENALTTEYMRQQSSLRAKLEAKKRQSQRDNGFLPIPEDQQHRSGAGASPAFMEENIEQISWTDFVQRAGTDHAQSPVDGRASLSKDAWNFLQHQSHKQHQQQHQQYSAHSQHMLSGPASAWQERTSVGQSRSASMDPTAGEAIPPEIWQRLMKNNPDAKQADSYQSRDTPSRMSTMTAGTEDPDSSEDEMVTRELAAAAAPRPVSPRLASLRAGGSPRPGSPGRASPSSSPRPITPGAAKADNVCSGVGCKAPLRANQRLCGGTYCRKSKHIGKMKIISEVDMAPRGAQSVSPAVSEYSGGAGSPLPLIEPASLIERRKADNPPLLTRVSTISIISVDDFVKNRAIASAQATSFSTWLADANFPNRVPPQEVVVECVVTRSKESSTHEYELHLDASGAPSNETFMLGARKRVKTKTPYYAITQNIKDPTCKRTGFVGKLRATNFWGLTFEIFCVSEKKVDEPSRARTEANTKADCHQVAHVRFRKNPLGMFGTTQLDGALTPMNRSGERVELPFASVKPKYDEQQKRHVMDFGGRVRQGSLKNFQVEFEGVVVLQMGKRDDDSFILDFRRPITPVIAMGICLASLHGKHGLA